MLEMTITIEAEVTDADTAQDVITALEVILPYMTNNVLVRSVTA